MHCVRLHEDVRVRGRIQRDAGESDTVSPMHRRTVRLLEVRPPELHEGRAVVTHSTTMTDTWRLYDSEPY
jgi:hypothetical protein